MIPKLPAKAARTCCLLLACLLASGVAHADENTNWFPLTAPDNTGRPPACALTTPHQTMDDTQGTTSVWLELTPDALTVKTKSDIDAEFGDLAIKAGGNAPVPFDEVSNQTDVVFRKATGKLIRQFILARNVKVQLRFWPTWPAAGVRSVKFSLMGFTQAYASLPEACGAQPIIRELEALKQQNEPKPEEDKEKKDESGNKI